MAVDAAVAVVVMDLALSSKLSVLLYFRNIYCDTPYANKNLNHDDRSMEMALWSRVTQKKRWWVTNITKGEVGPHFRSSISYLPIF